ncbi:hypothetical protein ABPG72_004149 [Tetrahymena utriculariae]
MIAYIQDWKQNYDTKELFNRQVKVFIILFLGYSSLHCMRTGWSFTQKYIQDDLPEITDKDIGYMDTAFLLFLGIGLYFCGNKSDHFNPKNFLLTGMIISASCLAGIGILRVFFITEVYIYVILQAFNGLFESACLPGYMRMLGNWYSSENRGILLGIWSGCRSFGDTFGLLIGDLAILRLHFSWYWSLVVFGSICLFMAYIIYEFTSESPSSTGLATIEEDELEDSSVINPSFIKRPLQYVSNTENQEQQQTNMDADDLERLREKLQLKYGSFGIINPTRVKEEYKGITVYEAFQIPGVIWYTVDFMCLKGLNYGILFWFPKFLQQNHLESNSSGISIMWSFGVLVGGIVSGYVGDRLHKRRGILMPPSLILLAFSLFYFHTLNSKEDSLINFYLTSLLIGIFLGGPYNVQHGPLIIDLGKHSVLKGNQQAIGTVTGIIEGAGSLASSIIQLLIPIFGQENIFLLFIVITLIAIVFIMPVAIEDYKYLKTKPTFFKKSKPNLTMNHELKNLNTKLLAD